MDQPLPKQLQISIEHLLNEQMLSGWTIHGNPTGTTIVLRFKMEDVIPSQSIDSIKYKRASASQVARDSARNQQRSKAVDKVDAKSSENDGKELTDSNKLYNIAKCSEETHAKLEQFKLPPPMTSPVKSPRITRSKAKPRSQPQPSAKPSPVPQVDGTSEERVTRSSPLPSTLTIDMFEQCLDRALQGVLDKCNIGGNNT